MARIPQIRGALLEEIVIFLLTKSGYRRVLTGEEGTRKGSAGLEVEGRGSRHQIDALVTPLHSHAFIYPIRLLVEAKCVKDSVGLPIIRSVVGALYDINQNLFSRSLSRGRQFQVQRFNYHAAMFASNGYTRDAERYALAHQIFLIDYSYVASMRPVVDALIALKKRDFGDLAQGGGRRNLTRIREGFRLLLERRRMADAPGLFSDRGVERVRQRLLPAIRELRGSYYGMIEGIYPVHLISRRAIPVAFIRERGVIQCEIRVSDDEQTWAFEPSGIPVNANEFFRLEFTIPEFIADMLSARTEEHGVREEVPRWLRIANTKQEYMRFIDVTTVHEGQLLPFRLVLDINWLNRYVEGRQARAARRRGRRELPG